MKILTNLLWAKNIKLIGITLLSFGAGFGLSSFLIGNPPKHKQVRLENHKLISPLMDCVVDGHSPLDIHPDFLSLQKTVNREVDEHLKDKSAKRISVYFKDLKSGYWFGLHDSDIFPPASLMKVPLMMAILQRAEQKPEIMKEQIAFKERDERWQGQSFMPREPLKLGSFYSVDDLIYRMIAYSDNDATLLLTDHFGMGIVDDTLAELSIRIDASQEDNRIMLRDYSAFFRILFNSSYLSRTMSERALDYLTKSTFERGIRAGVPNDMIVASKFGEYNMDSYQLHEFAIVYFPDHPYILGVVTTGGTTDSLPHVIHEISFAIYRELNRQHGVAY